MKDMLMLIAVFAVGYLLTMAVVIAMVRLFFPFKAVEKSGASPVHFVKSARHARHARKVNLANG